MFSVELERRNEEYKSVNRKLFVKELAERLF
jgi:hypothetical protein